MAAVTRSGNAVLLLMIAGIITLIAAVIGLMEWASVIAAVTAVVSGLSLLRSNLVVPSRPADANG